MMLTKKIQSSWQDITAIGIFANVQLDIQELPFFQNIFQSQSLKISPKKNTPKKEESSLSNSKISIWLLLTFPTLDKNLIDFNIESIIMISASKDIAINSKRKRQLLFVEILMYAIKKSILQDQKVTKKLRDSPFKKEIVSLNSYKMDGLTLLGSSILHWNFILGGESNMGIVKET